MLETFSELPVQNDTLFLTHWQPEGKKTKAVMVVTHGMAEHAGRYREFAQRLTEKGFSVFAHDHRGHGRSVNNGMPMGHFADTHGWRRATDDLKTLLTHAVQTHPELPIFLYGHSMGSFLVRDVIAEAQVTLSGAIISGTADMPGILATAFHLLAKGQEHLFGPRVPSHFIDRLTFGLYNLFFTPTRTPYDWLCANPASVDRYMNDPLCGSISTTAFFKDMSWGLMRISRTAHIKKTPKDLPLLFLAGDKDPVANFGLALPNLTRRYKKSGHTRVKSHLYKGARHELFGETQKERVYDDILTWIQNEERHP